MKKTQTSSGRITIYAELSKSQLGMLERNEAEIEVPYGTEMNNRPIGKRGLLFYCANEEVGKELVRGLESSAISWQIQEGSLEKKEE